MDKLIAIKLTALLLFLFTFLTMTPNSHSTEKSAPLNATATQVVKICHINDIAYVVPTNCNDLSSTNIQGDENGIATLKLDIHAANLVGTISGHYTLPPSVTDPMYIEYDHPLGGIGVTDQIIQFDLETLGTNGGPSLFVAYVDLVYDFSEFCEQANRESVPLLSNARLVSTNFTHAPNTLFPIHDYSDPTDIFTCEIFYETCNFDDCPSVPSPCDGGLDYAAADIYFCVNCSGLGGGGGGGGHGHDGYVDFQSDIQADKTSYSVAEIIPNPFQSTFNVKLNLENEQHLSVSVYDLRGQLMAQLKRPGLKGMNQIEVDSYQWENGIYYIHIQGKSSSQVLKLVKF